MYMFNKSQKALKDKVGSFVREEVMPVAQELDKIEFSRRSLLNAAASWDLLRPSL